MIISISSDPHEAPTGHATKHGHAAEASAMLFQIFVQIARMYVHKKSESDKEWVENFNNFIPPFIVYADHMRQNRGEQETRTLLVKMWGESSRVFLTGLKSAYVDAKYQHLEKTTQLDDLVANAKIVNDLVEYGEKFISHVSQGKDENVKSIVSDLTAIMERHRKSHAK